ncbi:MAG: CopG family transcriptional regulator [Actinomycetota bacterium]|nr:CopG family transcriptional regulator [Actinomycetota bacterium]
MRTTLNLDEDVARRLSELSRRSGRSLSRVSNEVLRAGLRALQQRPPIAPYDPPVFDTGRPLVDVTDVAEALELLECD